MAIVDKIVQNIWKTTKKKPKMLLNDTLSSDQRDSVQTPFKVEYVKLTTEGTNKNIEIVESVQIVRTEENSIINIENRICDIESGIIEMERRIIDLEDDTLATSKPKRLTVQEINLRIISDQSIESIGAENAIIIHGNEVSDSTADEFVERSISFSTAFADSDNPTLAITCVVFCSLLFYMRYCKPSDPYIKPIISKHSIHMLNSEHRNASQLATSGRSTSTLCLTETQKPVTSIVTAHHRIFPTVLSYLTESPKKVTYSTAHYKCVLLAKEGQRNEGQAAFFENEDLGKQVSTTKLHTCRDLKRKADMSTVPKKVKIPRRVVGKDEENYQNGIKTVSIYPIKQSLTAMVDSEYASRKRKRIDNKKYPSLAKIMNQCELRNTKPGGNIVSNIFPENEKPNQVLKKLSDSYSVQDEVPGKRIRPIIQMPNTITKLSQEVENFWNNEPNLNISLLLLHDKMFGNGSYETDDIENCALSFDELSAFLSNGSVMSILLQKYLEDSEGKKSVDSIRQAKYYVGLKQIVDDKECTFFLLSQETLENEQTGELQQKPKIRLVTVSAEVFENAMRQSQIYEYEVTFSNYFPRNCRMFIAIPVYKGGFINRRDEKDRR